MPTDHNKKSPNARKRIYSEISESIQFGLGCLVIVSFLVVGLASRFLFDRSWVASFWVALLVALSFKVIQEVVERLNHRKRRKNS